METRPIGKELVPLICLVGDLQKKGIQFRSLSDAIDTRTAGGRLQFHLLGALAEFERSLISERTRAGMAAARGRGVNLGRPPKLSARMIEAAISHSQSFSLAEVARHLEVSLSTLRRALSARNAV